MRKIKGFIGDIYENYYQEYQKKFDAIDLDFGARFADAITQKEITMIRKGGKHISKLEELNIKCQLYFKMANLDFTSPSVLRCYVLIHQFLNEIINKFESEHALTAQFDKDIHNKGGRYESKNEKQD